MSKPVVMLVTIAAWALGCVYTAYAYAAAHAAPYYADEYLYEFVYQLSRFGVFRFPFWLLGLLAAVSAEALMLKPLKLR